MGGWDANLVLALFVGWVFPTTRSYQMTLNNFESKGLGDFRYMREETYTVVGTNILPTSAASAGCLSVGVIMVKMLFFSSRKQADSSNMKIFGLQVKRLIF